MKSQLSGLEYANACMMRIYPIMCIRHPVLRNRKIAFNNRSCNTNPVPISACTHTENKTKQVLPVTCVQNLSSLSISRHLKPARELTLVGSLVCSNSLLCVGRMSF